MSSVIDHLKDEEDMIIPLHWTELQKQYETKRDPEFVMWYGRYFFYVQWVPCVKAMFDYKTLQFYANIIPLLTKHPRTSDDCYPQGVIPRDIHKYAGVTGLIFDHRTDPYGPIIKI
jgi:hypothetical protein